MSSSKIVSLKTYASLRSAVRKAISSGKERARAAVERERVQTAWEVGKLVLSHILLHQDRADYGKKILPRLADDLSISHSQIKYMVEFARAYPIGQPAGQLSWSHYQTLLSINDSKVREKFIQKAQKQNWTRKQLRSELKEFKSKKSPISKAPSKTLQEPPRYPAQVYRKVKWRSKWVSDLGFSNYLEVPAKVSKKQPKKEELYYYEALVDRVVDGDTLWADIQLGFGFWSHQKLRLRGINSPEAKSEKGARAKRYLVRKLPRGKKILIHTTWPDKYDRYLADVWVGQAYLNQQVVSAGHARVV